MMMAWKAVKRTSLPADATAPKNNSSTKPNIVPSLTRTPKVTFEDMKPETSAPKLVIPKIATTDVDEDAMYVLSLIQYFANFVFSANRIKPSTIYAPIFQHIGIR
jgi:hypothetical protein